MGPRIVTDDVLDTRLFRVQVPDETTALGLLVLDTEVLLTLDGEEATRLNVAKEAISYRTHKNRV